jgi:hypothetical protein
MKKIILLCIGLLITVYSFSQSMGYNSGYVSEKTNGIWGSWTPIYSVSGKVLFSDKKLPTAIEINYSEYGQLIIRLKNHVKDKESKTYDAEVASYEFKKGYTSLSGEIEKLIRKHPIGAAVRKVNSKFYIWLVWDDDNGLGFGLCNDSY